MTLRLLLSALLLSVASLHGDDSSMNEGAYGPEPRGALSSDESIVRMESEKITVRFGKKASEVTARFVFRSAKPDAPARQLVGFPDFGAAFKEAERRDPKGDAPWQPHENVSGEIENLRTFVDNEEVPSKLDYGYIVDDEKVGWKPGTPKDGTLMAWHTLWVTFPPKTDVVVERRYRVPNGEMVGGIQTFFYTAVTGANWRGTIGRMDVDMTLDGWTVDDLAWEGGKRPQVWESGPYTSPGRKGWEILSPTHLRFTWDDFEPRDQSDRRDFTLATVGTEKPVRGQ